MALTKYSNAFSLQSFRRIEKPAGTNRRSSHLFLLCQHNCKRHGRPSICSGAAIYLTLSRLSPRARSFARLLFFMLSFFVLPDRLKYFGADVRQMTATVLQNDDSEGEEPVIATPKLPRTPHTMPR